MSEPITSNYDYLIKMLALGDSSVGKTCFINYYITKSYNADYGNTVGVDFKQKIYNYKPEASSNFVEREAKLNLQIWDTAGQERFRSLTISFFRDAMGFILMFSIADEQSFLNLREWLRVLRTNAYCDTPDMILVGNKCDLEDKRQVSYKDAKEFADEMKIEYVETSAKSGKNINNVFDILVKLIMRRISDTVDSSILPISKGRNNSKKELKSTATENKEGAKKKCPC